MEIKVEIPEELREQAEESGLDLSTLVKQFIALKLFEKQFSESVVLQRAVFESLASKSELTEKGAKELADKINMGMSESLKHKSLVL